MACVDLQLVCLCRPAPLRANELRLVEGEGLAACRLPTQTGFCEPALARLLGEVEVDVVKGLPNKFVRPVLMVAIHQRNRLMTHPLATSRRQY